MAKLRTRIALRRIENITSVFNSFFNRITNSLLIPEIPELLVTNLDPVSSAIAKYATHPSIVAIKSKANTPSMFELHATAEDDMIKENLIVSYVKSASGSIPIKALKVAVFDFAGALTKPFNDNVVDQSSFPDELKFADILPVHKKGRTTDKANSDLSVCFLLSRRCLKDLLPSK